MIKNFILPLSQVNPLASAHKHIHASKLNKASKNPAVALFALILILVFGILTAVNHFIFGHAFLSSNLLTDELQAIVVFLFILLWYIVLALSKYSFIKSYQQRALYYPLFDVIANLVRKSTTSERQENLSAWFEYWQIGDTRYLKIFPNGFLTASALEELPIKVQSHLIASTQKMNLDWTFQGTPIIRQGYVLMKFGQAEKPLTIDYKALSDKRSLLKLSKSVNLPNFHLSISGQSGTGKTALMTAIILKQAVTLRDWFVKSDEDTKAFLGDFHQGLYVLDPKKGDIYSLRYSVKSNGFGQFGSTPAEAILMLTEFYHELNRRASYFDNPSLPLGMNWQKLSWFPMYFVIDEMIDLFLQADKKQQAELQRLLTQVITKGRQVGCFVIVATMRPDTKYLNGETRATMTKILLANRRLPLDKDTALMMFNTTNTPQPADEWEYYSYIQSETGGVKVVPTPALASDIDVRALLNQELG